MSSRGRGNVSIKRGALPNLALAGKREDSSSASSNSRGGKREGRGRGRGRGRGGGRGGLAKQALIQSEGIFSDGLCASEKKAADREPGISFTIARKRPKEDEKEEREFRDPGQGWEQMWESDEEEDQAGLAELMKDDFISDYRRGDRMPIILPQQDENQFFNILEKKAKEELFSDQEEELNDEEEKPNAGGITFETSMDDSATSAFSRQAGEIFLKKKKTKNDIFMLQLPSAMNILAAGVPTEDKTDKTDYSQGEPIDYNDKSRTVPKLPAGSKIGTLKISRTGRVFLVINGVRIDISKSTNGGQQDGVILVENATRKEGPIGGILHVRASEEGTDSVYHLGNVAHCLSGSLSWSEIQPKSAKLNQNCYSPSKQANGTRSVSDNELKEKLAKLSKEAASWSSLAEQWAAPPVEIPSVVNNLDFVERR